MSMPGSGTELQTALRPTGDGAVSAVASVPSPLTANALRERLMAPSDPLVLGLFRIAFGVVMALSALRFLWLDWGAALYVEPVTRFAYPGFGWVPRPSAVRTRKMPPVSCAVKAKSWSSKLRTSSAKSSGSERLWCELAAKAAW